MWQQATRSDAARAPSLHDRLGLLRNWSVVVDDGSHKPSDQLHTFLEIFPRVEPRGVHNIEDIETSFYARGYGRGYLYNWNMADEYK